MVDQVDAPPERVAQARPRAGQGVRQEALEARADHMGAHYASTASMSTRQDALICVMAQTQGR